VCGVGSLEFKGLDPHGLLDGGKRAGDLGPNGPDSSVDESNRCRNGLPGVDICERPGGAGDTEIDGSYPVGGLGVLDGFLLLPKYDPGDVIFVDGVNEDELFKLKSLRSLAEY
jgi:hypothetical protein